VGWFYTYEQLLLDSKLKDILHKRKKAPHQTQQTHTHTHKREIETTVHREEEKREREREREREKVAWEAVLQGKDKAPCFRQQNHMTLSLQTHPTL
jgi:hypothetical protein